MKTLVSLLICWRLALLSVAAQDLLFLAGSPRITPPDPNLLWWRLNDGGGTAITAAAGPNGTTTAGWAAGVGGSALELNPHGEKANTVSSITYNTNIITITFWIQWITINSADIIDVICESGVSATTLANSWLIYMQGGELKVLSSGTTGGTYRVENFTPPAPAAGGPWHHVAIVIDQTANSGKGDVKGYFNGAVQTSVVTGDTKTGNQFFTAATLYVGHRAAPQWYLNARLDDLRIYSGELTQAQITAVMQDGSADPAGITQDFNSYTAGVSLATLPGWTVPYGAFTTIAGGTVSGNAAGGNCFALYQPAGWTTSAVHEAEVTYAAAADGAGNVFHGPVVAMQANGTGYIAQFDNNGVLYFGSSPTGGGIVAYVSVDTGAGIPAGTKVRLTATGVGAARRCSCSYNLGGGWVTPAGWADRVMAANYDGGQAGVAGYGNALAVKLDSLTIRNQP